MIDRDRRVSIGHSIRSWGFRHHPIIRLATPLSLGDRFTLLGFVRTSQGALFIPVVRSKMAARLQLNEWRFSQGVCVHATATRSFPWVFARVAHDWRSTSVPCPFVHARRLSDRHLARSERERRVSLHVTSYDSPSTHLGVYYTVFCAMHAQWSILETPLARRRDDRDRTDLATVTSSTSVARVWLYQAWFFTIPFGIWMTETTHWLAFVFLIDRIINSAGCELSSGSVCEKIGGETVDHLCSLIRWRTLPSTWSDF